MKANNMKKIFPKLAFICAKYKITQAELCRYMGVSRQTLYHWKNGDNLPQLQSLKQIGDKLGIPARYIIDDTLNIEEVV